jgi:hypothetical protein
MVISGNVPSGNQTRRSREIPYISGEFNGTIIYKCFVPEYLSRRTSRSILDGYQIILTSLLVFSWEYLLINQQRIWSIFCRGPLADWQWHDRGFFHGFSTITPGVLGVIVWWWYAWYGWRIRIFRDPAGPHKRLCLGYKFRTAMGLMDHTSRVAIWLWLT